MAKNQMMGSTVMTPAERRRIAEQQKARQKERDKIARERIQAAEFGAQMSPTASKDDKARARIRSNTKDVRFTGTKQTARVKAAGKKVADTQRAMDAAAAKRKITKAEGKTTKVTSKDPRGNQAKPTPGAAKKKEAAKTWKDVTSISAAKAAGLNYYSKGGKKMAAVTKADLDKSGLSLRDYLNYKTGKTRKAAPKKTTATAKKAAPKKPTTKSKDPRGNQIKATPGKKGPLASARKEYPVTGPGSQSKILRPKKAAAKIPAGAKPFKGSYNSRTHKLQNINGKTYVVKR